MRSKLVRAAQAGFCVVCVVIAVVAVAIIATAIYCGLSGDCKSGGGGGSVTVADCDSDWKSCHSRCGGDPDCARECDAERSNCGVGAQGLTPAVQECRSKYDGCVSGCVLASGGKALQLGKVPGFARTTSTSFDQCEVNCAAQRATCDPCLSSKLVCQSKAGVCVLACAAGDTVCVDACKAWYPTCLNPGRITQAGKDLAAKIDEWQRAQNIGGSIGGPIGGPPDVPGGPPKKP